MVQSDPSTLATVVVVSVSIMSFFTSSAADRIDNMPAGYLKFVSILSICGSYCLLFILGAIVVGSGILANNPVLFNGLKVVFVAFIIPSFILVFDLLNGLEDCWKDPDFNSVKGIALLVFISVLYYGLLQIGP